MRPIFFLMLLYGTISVWAQVNTFLSADFENDFINFRGRGTDCYYSGGNNVMLGIYYPHATLRAIGFSITQQTFTPSDLQEKNPAYLDYPYAGLLFSSLHTVTMPVGAKWRWYNKISLGCSGPKTGVAAWQRTVHRIIRDEQPQGWFLMQPTTYFLQFTSQLRYNLLTMKSWHLEVLQEAEGGNYFDRFQSGFLFYRGTLPPFMSLLSPLTHGYKQLVLNKRSSYFISLYFLSQYATVLRNRILEESNYSQTNGSFFSNASEITMKSAIYLVSGGVGVSNGKRGFYFTQHWQSREMVQLPSHSYGAIRFFFQLSHAD